MELLLVLAAGVLAFLTLATAVGMIVFSDRTFEVRLARARASAGPRGVGGRLQTLTPKMADTLQRVGEVAGRGALEGKDRAALRSRLVQAGFYSARAAEAFYGVRVATALGFGLLATLAAIAFKTQGSLLVILVVMLAAGAGLFLPNLLLSRRIASRARALRVALPDAMDLLVVCVEAGGTLSSAIQRVEAEFRTLHPVLAEQFSIVLLEMQAGSSRMEALNRLAARSPTEEIQNLVNLLTQSEALGASIAQALRVFAEQTRQARYIDAERRAAELPVKMAFPLVLLIFPALMTVIFTPIVIRLVRVLFPAGGG